MHSIQFGFCVPIFASPGNRIFRTANYPELDTATTMAMAQEADALGYDALWVADHLMLGKDNAILEGWTTLAALAGSTKRARLGIIHQAHFFRQPALAAKMMATLDQISNGRFIFFADPAFGRAEHLAYNFPYPEDVPERIERTVEGVKLALALWQSTKPVTFEGNYYRVDNATVTPLPVQQPHPPIWFGEANPLTLAACARYGQGWNTVPVTLEELRRRLDALAAACAEAGRPVEEIERSLETEILIAADEDGLRQRLREIMALAPGEKFESDVVAYANGETNTLPPSLNERYILGTPDEVSRRLQEYIDLGISHFMLWFIDVPRRDGIRIFAEEVMPRFRG
jgi:alkanesulfonate monooxygenase SsuD/methylene tetrahydromethanopterin reductase-like flavin-dependent oxidoreductase (luciferase family)